MGAQLAARCYLVPRPVVGYAAFRVLVRMALHALDTDHDDQPAGVYFAGWDTLALALGYGQYDDAAHRAVARAVAQLTDVGLVKAEGYATGGNRAYRLLI